MAETTTPRVRFTVKELIQIGCFSQILKRLPGSATLALYRVEGSDAVLYGCACCDRHDTAENMRNFGRYVTCRECGMQIGSALDAEDCHFGIPRGGFTLATTLQKVGELEAKDNGEHARIAADKLESEPGFLDNLFARAAREERRQADQARIREQHARRHDGPMAAGLRNVRASERATTPPAPPAQRAPSPAPLAAAVAVIAAPAQPESPAASVAPTPALTPPSKPAKAIDPVGVMNLQQVKRAMSDLKRVRKLLADAEFARQMRRLLDRQRELEDAELAELLGKGGEPAEAAPAPSAIPTPVPVAPAPTKGGLTVIKGGAAAEPPRALAESVDLVELTRKTLRNACELETSRRIGRGQILTAGGQVTSVTCVVAANSVACKAAGAPDNMAAFRGHPNLAVGKGSNMFPICRACKAIAASDNELVVRISRDQTYASVLAEEERQRRAHARHITPAPGAAHKDDKDKKPELTDAERALRERAAADRTFICANSGKTCSLPKGTRLGKVFDPETRRPTTDRGHGVCGKCLARMPRRRVPKPVVAEAPKPAKPDKAAREAAKRAARQGHR